jgi:hypothetical protein
MLSPSSTPASLASLFDGPAAPPRGGIDVNITASHGYSPALTSRLVAWSDTYQPSTQTEEWLFLQLVHATVRVDELQREETSLRSYLTQRAGLCWDVDRRAEVEETAARLLRDPSRVVRRLEHTRHGCRWLIERWNALGALAAAGTEWSDDHRSLAYNLLGTPGALRGAAPPWAGAGSPGALVEREVARLEQRCSDALDELDATERTLAEQGVMVETPRSLLALRREEATMMRRFLWARTQLQRAGAVIETDRPPAYAPAPYAPPPGPIMPGPLAGGTMPPPRRPTAVPRDAADFFRELGNDPTDLDELSPPLASGNRPESRRERRARMKQEYPGRR